MVKNFKPQVRHCDFVSIGKTKTESHVNIGRIFYDGSGIRMYKHRSRMAVLYEKKHDIIKIKCTDRKSRYKNIYREMREELKRVIGRRDIDL